MQVVHMYVCMYVYMYTCMYVCIYSYLYRELNFFYSYLHDDTRVSVSFNSDLFCIILNTDWAASYSDVNPEIPDGKCLVCSTNEGK